MENAIEVKSFRFAVRIVRLCKHLQENKKEYILSKQLLRSGTSIGANVAEAQQGQSRADFAAKLNIALKEAAETNYWLRLLHAAEYLSVSEFTSIMAQTVEKASQNLPRQRQTHLKTFLAAACTWTKIHLRLQVWNLSVKDRQIMRAADCKILAEKAAGLFRQAHGRLHRAGKAPDCDFENVPQSNQKCLTIVNCQLSIVH